MTIEAGALEAPDLVGLELGRIVDEQRERADRRGRGWNEAQHRLMVGEVGVDHRRAAAARHDLGAQAFGLVARAPNMERDRVAALRERKRDGAADSLRAAGDEGRAAGRGRRIMHVARRRAP
jgi:hypothetical protein